MFCTDVHLHPVGAEERGRGRWGVKEDEERRKRRDSEREDGW